MGGYKVQPEAEQLIIRIWKQLVAQKRDASAKRVLQTAETYIRSKNINNIFLPKIRKVQNILKEARQLQSQLPPSIVKMQEPWSLFTLDNYPIPPESVPSVLDVWRYSVNIGEPLTIRQAKWVSRLHHRLSDIVELWLFACNYAERETLSLYSDPEEIAISMDSILTMKSREVETINIPKWKHLNMITLPSKPEVYIAQDGGMIEEFFHALPGNYSSSEQGIDYYAEYECYLVSLLTELPSSQFYFSNVEARLIYLRQLSYLVQGNNWCSFKPEEIRDIIIELRSWVLNATKRIESKKHREELSSYPYENIKTKYQEYSLFDSVDIKPIELYKKVGFTDYNETMWEALF